MAEQKRGLGRGFDSLIPTQIVEAEFDVTAKVAGGDQLREVAPALVDPNPHQPRVSFDQAELEALAASIRIHGILQPLVATQSGDRYELIAGERRLRAAKIAGLKTVPLIVRSFDEQQKLELALLENLQRSDLNAIEVATAYHKLMDQFNMTQDDIARQVGKNVTTVINTLRLLALPIEVKRAVTEGRISEGHARAILGVPDTAKQLELLGLVEKHQWNVRQTEAFARSLKEAGGTKEKAAAKVAATNELTQGLSDYLGVKVSQVATSKGGRIVIEYTSDEELDRIYHSIKRD